MTKKTKRNEKYRLFKVLNLENIQKKAHTLSEDFYPIFGEFVISFEHLCHSIRMGITDILEQEGLRNSKLSNILIGDLTMFPLQNIYRALLIETQSPNQNEINIIDTIFKKIIKLTEERNKIIHSAWFIDFKNFDDIKSSSLTGYKTGYSKKGAKPSRFKYPISEIKSFTKMSRELTDIIHQLNLCIYTGTPIATCFEFDSNNNIKVKGLIREFFQTTK